MTRDEHLTWCKKRALEYLNQNDIKNAITSMMSDLGKHPETAKMNASITMLGMMYIMNNDYDGAKRFIEGFR